MKLKHFLALAACTVMSTSAWADVWKDVTSDYLLNADFESGVDDSKQKTSTGGSRPIYCPQSWVLGYDTGYQFDGTALNSSHTTIWNNVSTAAGKIQNGGDNTYMVRFTSKGTNGYTTLTLTQTNILPKGQYKISADCYFETGSTNNTNSRFIVNIGGTEKTGDAFSSATTWSRQEYVFEANGTDNIKYGVRARKNRTTDATMVAGYDNFKLELNLTQVLKDLVDEAEEAFMEGDETSDGTTFQRAINAAKTKYEATEVSTIDNAISTLSDAITTYKNAKATLQALQYKLSAYIVRAAAINAAWNNPELTAAIEAATTLSTNANAGTQEVTNGIDALNDKLPSNTINITNASFDTESSWIAENVAAQNSTSNNKEVEGWTASGSYTWTCSAAFGIGSGKQNNSVVVPTTDMYGQTSGGVLGISNSYSNTLTYNQTIANLEAGKYLLYYEVYNATSNSFGSNKTGINETYDDQTSFTENAWSANAFLINFDTDVENASLQIGYKANSSGSGSNAKLFYDNITLYYLGWDATTALSKIGEKVSEAEVLKDEVMKATVNTEINTAITEANGYITAGTCTKQQATASISRLTAAITAANTSISNYSAAKAFIGAKATAVATLDQDGKDSYNNDATVSTVTAGYNDKTLEVLTDDQKTEIEAALITAVKAQTTEGADFTLLIQNPSFESNWDGWTHSNFTRENNNSLAKTGSWYVSAWHQGASNCKVEQTITGLPAGKYRLTVYAAAREQSKCSVYLGSANVWPGNAQNYTINAYIEDGSDVKIGASCQAWTDADSWLAVDNFRLTLLEKGDPAFIIAKENLSSVIKSAPSESVNVGTDAFQIPEAAATTYASAKETAQNALDNPEATVESLTAAKTTFEAAITTFRSTLNAPASGKKFNFTLGGSNSWAGKAITYIAGGRTDHGGYGVSYEAAPNSNYAQAFTMTQIEGNRYKMSQTDADGNERYLCTGTVYGGNNNQIRTTTDENDALVVEIVPTDMAGVYNIKNTLANANIGSKDNGVYTNDNNGTYVVDFSITEATQASVNLVVTAAKYGTFFAPFNAEKPEGVTLYTCASVENDVLTLEEADAIVANTPYIVYSESEVNETLDGWGLAKQDSYTAGVLTGVYTSTPAQNSWYVLQNNENKVGFYEVDTEVAIPTVGANRCYLTIPSTGARVRAFYFNGAASGINTAASEDAIEAIYTANGTVVSALQSGLNIVKMKSGKVQKVLVK